MDDRAIRGPAGWAAIGVAASSFAYAATLVLGTTGANGLAPISERTLVQQGNWLLALTGLVATLAVVGVAARIAAVTPGTAHLPWLAWGAGLGVLGGSMTAAHGFYDAYRVPILLAQWSAVEARQPAISVLVGLPNPADPRGLGTLLFMAFFVWVAARLVDASPGAFHKFASPLGRLHAVVLALAFVMGMAEVPQIRAAVTGLALGVTGPIWWFLMGKSVLAGHEGG